MNDISLRYSQVNSRINNFKRKTRSLLAILLNLAIASLSKTFISFALIQRLLFKIHYGIITFHWGWLQVCHIYKKEMQLQLVHNGSGEEDSVVNVFLQMSMYFYYFTLFAQSPKIDWKLLAYIGFGTKFKKCMSDRHDRQQVISIAHLDFSSAKL